MLFHHIGFKMCFSLFSNIQHISWPCWSFSSHLSQEKNKVGVAGEKRDSMARIPTAGISMVYSYINKQSFTIFLLLLLLGPRANHVEIKAETTNGFRCSTTECCVMQLFHISSNAKPGKKALCSRMWHPGILLFTGLKYLPHFS